MQQSDPEQRVSTHNNTTDHSPDPSSRSGGFWGFGTFPKKWLFISFLIVILSLGIGVGFAYFSIQHPSASASLRPLLQSPKHMLSRFLADTASENITLQQPVHPKRLETPSVVRGIYISSWVAGEKQWRRRLLEMAKQASINAFVIDVKDSTGYISFDTQDPDIQAMGTQDIRIRDLRDWLAELRENNIYTIARIAVFQDPLYAKKYPEYAVKTRSGAIWKDRNGLSFIDVSYPEFWKYIVKISKISIEIGFDELNYDYIRFPTDGNLDDMVFPVTSQTSFTRQPTANITIKVLALERFFAYLRSELSPYNIPMSADIFGMTLTTDHDLGIGQVLEVVEPYFDYICPMIYPSHWPSGFINIKNPAARPYEIVRHSVEKGLTRIPKSKMRPWLQDFDMGAKYDATLMRAQKLGMYELGVHSFLMWDPANQYKSTPFEPAPIQAVGASRNVGVVEK